MRSLRKRFVSIFISITLGLLWCQPSFAGAPSGNGKVWSVEYAFGLALEANGIHMEPGHLTHAVNSFKAWLKKNGHSSALSFYNDVDKASWGASVSGMEEFTSKVKLYLQESAAYGSSDDGVFLCLPPLVSSFVYQTSSHVPGIWNEKYSDILEIPNRENYDYIYSDTYFGSTDIYRTNIYSLKGEELIAITDFPPYGTSLFKVEFYKLDPSNSLGYSPTSLYKMVYDASTNTAYTGVSQAAFSYYTFSQLSLLPFPVFPSSETAQEYCRTGSLEFAFRSDSAPFPISKSRNEIAGLQAAEVPDTITLPSSSAQAQAVLSSFSSYSSQDVLGALDDAGFPISYWLPYTVEYYKDEENVKTVSGTIRSSDPYIGESKLTGFKNYLLDASASSPLPFQVTLTDNVITASYIPDPDAEYPYTVEYHRDGEVFRTASGSVPVFGDRTVTFCEDFCPQYYLPDSKASTPLPFEVSEYNNTIHIYYKRDVYATFPYTVEYYKDGELFKTVPGSVSVFNPSVKSCVSYCPNGYVLDTAASTPLPYNVPEDGGGVIKNYYVKQDTVISYTVEYYRDGLRKNTYSGNVPASSPVVQSCPSYCPEYYELDAERSDSFPYTLSGGTSRNRIRIYYKKDEDAVFPYTVECYKDGELVETASKTISVFSPAVKEYGFDCPEGYVVDTSSSTSLPYSVSKDSNVIKYYYVDEGRTLPYTVEYHKDGKIQMTLAGNVPVTSPQVKQYWPYSPSGYLLDEATSDPLPFTVTEENHVIHAYYIPDPSDPYASFVGGVRTLINSIADVFKRSIWWLILLVMLCIFCDRNLVLFRRLMSHVWAKEPKRKQKPSKKSFTAPKSKFMKGVHAVKGSSLRSKAGMGKGSRPGSLRSKANLANRKRL